MLYKEQQAGAGAGAAASGDGASAAGDDEEVIDADYTEEQGNS